jgi:lipopolysaccharide transport system ATP-binding protein
MINVIKVEQLSKAYRLGQISTGTLSRDLNFWWAKVRGKSNPLLRIGETDHGNRNGEILWALKDVSFSVEQGEVLGIIGKNGAGKSTLLKILSRVTAPTSGKVSVRGRIASLLEVGTGFHPDLTARENIYLNGTILGMVRKEIDRKFDEIVAFSGEEKFIDTPVKRFSSGMYVRLAFAVAAHLDPEILIVDEVLAVGDAEFQRKCLGKMGDVAGEGRTVLFVSHNMGAIEYLCEKCLLLEAGHIINNSDDVHSVIRQYIGKSSMKGDSEDDWSRLKNNHFRLINFNLLRKKDQLKLNVFSRGDDIEIEFILDVFETDPHLLIGYALYELEQDNCLWWSFHIDKEFITLKSGINALRTTIPKGLLNEKSYKIELLAASPVDGWIVSPEKRIGLEFTVKGSTIGSSEFISTKREQFLMPLFDWNHEVITNQEERNIHRSP